ncbi:ES1 protein homolog, mitochondrial-like [Trichogramma pretiosum]|uniref:ES1 protein homolog, mitochondrial-like n=1 Tax=Trichogramma pretiosum TaxID=7493 RepID=UPI0006C9C58B|nr:ES1 protein homolog, mitochondrial-like [Trichogramma pretiosum]
MMSRFSPVRFLAAGVSKLAATRKAASNLLSLHTSATCKEPGVKRPRDEEPAGQEPASKKPRVEPARKKKKANILAKPRGPFATDAPQVAVVVSGCGDTDGSSILETTSLAVHLHRCGLAAELFAPKQENKHYFVFETREFKKNVVNDGDIEIPIKPTRNTLSEAARLLVNHPVRPLEQLDHRRYKALFIPGGAGVGYILSNFLNAANAAVVNPFLHLNIQDFYKSKKPIGTISYGGILVAKCIPKVRITIGRSDGDRWLPRDLIGLATALEAEHVDKRADETCDDDERYVYSTPGLTVRTDPRHEIFNGIGKLVDAISRRIKELDGKLDEGAAPLPQVEGSNQQQIAGQ